MENFIISAILVDTILEKEEERQKKKDAKKRVWSKQWLLKRNIYSHMILLKELEDTCPPDFKNFVRMDVETYKYLLELVTPLIQKENTIMRDAISPNERLSATLRFLATGCSFEDLKFKTRIASSTLSKIILETCKAIIHVLKSYISVSLIKFALIMQFHNNFLHLLYPNLNFIVA